MKINEISTGPKTPSTPSTPWGLIQKLALLMEVTLRVYDTDFDGDEATNDAINLMKIWASDNIKGANIHHALENIKACVTHYGVFDQVQNANRALADWGYRPVGWFQDGLDANAILVQKSKGMADHAKAVGEIFDFLRLAHSVMEGKSSNKTWNANIPFVRAALKKLGII